MLTDGPTDGPTDGRTDERTYGRTHPLIEMRRRIKKLYTDKIRSGGLNRSPTHTHRSLFPLLCISCFARMLHCAHSLARSLTLLIASLMVIYSVFSSILDHCIWLDGWTIMPFYRDAR